MRKVSFNQSIRILIISITILLAACSSDDNEDTAGKQIKTIVANPIILTHSLTEDIIEEMGERVEDSGTLYYHEGNNCMFVENAEKESILPIWPKGSTPTMEGNYYGVQVAGSDLKVEGEKLDLIGQQMSPEELGKETFPEECYEAIDKVIIIE